MTKLVAFYLPQFHPFPENDAWWGKGFTEWTNVTRSKPLFIGHYQPHLPTDFGFYDLRVSEVWQEQAEVAKKFGIDAFCYHYYWFSGKRLMEKPLDAMLSNKKIDMPFMLCWANENWTRRWDAAEHQVLIEQKYLPEDPVLFIKSIEPYLRDERYVEKDGKKVLIVYRPQHLPNAREWTDEWRKYARSAGLGDLFLVCALTHESWNYSQYGFDAGVEFPPHNLNGTNESEVKSSLGFTSKFSGHVYDFKDIAELYLNRDAGAQKNYFSCVFPSWDNTARRKHRALVTLNGTPENYENWLQRAIEKTNSKYPTEQRFVFINAWNEWAEGCHLEPDLRHGDLFLKATLNAKLNAENAKLNAEKNPRKKHEWHSTGLPTECDGFAQTKAVAEAAYLKQIMPTKNSFLRRKAHALRDFFRYLRGRRTC
jgi:lipopolysaccharide biosynthesis protein